MPKAKNRRERSRSPTGSPTPRPRRGRSEIPPSPATPSTRTSTRVPKATSGAMDFIKTTAARRATAAAGADTSAVDVSNSASTKRAPAPRKNTSAPSKGTSTAIKNESTMVHNASTSNQDVLTPIPDASMPSKDASAPSTDTSVPSKNARTSKKKAPASITKGTNPRTRKQAQVEVSILSEPVALPLEDPDKTQPPEAEGGRRLRSRAKDTPAATPKPTKAAGKRARIVDKSQEETSALPTADDSGRPPTPVTARHVKAGDGGMSTVGATTNDSSNVKPRPKPKPKPVHRDKASTEGASVAESSRPGATTQPDASDGGMPAGDSNRTMRDAPEARDGQVMVADSRIHHPLGSSAVPPRRLSLGSASASHDGDASFTVRPVVEHGRLEDVQSKAPAAHEGLHDAPQLHVHRALGLPLNSPDVVHGASPIVRPQGLPHGGQDHVRQDVRDHVGQDVGREVEHDVRDHVGQDVGREVEQNIQDHVGQHVGREVEQDVRNHVGHHVEQYVAQDVRNHVGQYVGRDVEQDVRNRVGQYVGRDVRYYDGQYVGRDVEQHGGHDVREHTGQHVGQHSGHDDRNHVQQHVERNIEQHVGRDVGQQGGHAGRDHAEQNVRSHIRHDIPGHVGPSIQHNDGKDVRGHVGQGAQYEVAHNIPNNIQHPVLHHLQQGVPPHLWQQGPAHAGHNAVPYGWLAAPHHLPPQVPHTEHGVGHGPHAQLGPFPNQSPSLPSHSLGNAGPSAGAAVPRHPYDAVLAHEPDMQHKEHGGSDSRLMFPAAPWRRTPFADGPVTQGPLDTVGRMDVTPALLTQVVKDAPTNTGPGVPTDVRHDVRHDLRTDDRHDDQTDVRHNVRHDVRHNVRHDVRHNVRHDVRTDDRHDVPTHAGQNVPANVSQDVPKTVRRNVRADSPHKVPMDVSPDVGVQAHHNVHMDVGADDYTQVSHNVGDHNTHSSHKKVKQAVHDEGEDSDEEHADAAANPHDDIDDNNGGDLDSDNDDNDEVPGDDEEEDMVGDGNDSADDAAEYEAIFGDTKAVGRVSKANKAIIKSSFDEVITIARRASKQTGLSVGQVYDQWNVKRTRHNIKSNRWNSYQVYHREHAAQERSRLSQDVLEGSKESDIPRLCYKKFKKKYGKKADNILESYRQLRELSGAGTTTVARRKQEWSSWCTDMKQKANVGHLVHGFSFQIIAVGNVINSDSSLAMIHASKDAQGFFPTRFRVDDDTAIGHMKALVYNNVSLAVVEMSQHDDLAAAGQLGPHAAGPSNVLAIPAGGPVGPKYVNVAQAAFREILQDIKYPSSRTRAPFIVSALRGLLRLLGPEGAAVANISNFQWKKFGMMLAAQNITIVNYPEEPVPMPRAGPEDDDTKTRSKGLSGLGAKALQFFMDAIMKPHRTHPLGFVLYTGLRADLVNSAVPVITGVPPRPSSDFTHGRRYFVNGVTDRAGLKRRLPSADDSDDDEAPVYDKKLAATNSGAAADSDDEEDDKADVDEVEPRAMAVNKRAASPRRTRSKTNPTQPAQSKAVDKTKVANNAKAAGITLRTVAVEIPETPVPRKRAEKPDDAITVSSGTGSRYSPSRSPTPGPSKSRGTKKRKADDLRCDSDETESLSDILAAAATIAKGKHRAEDVGMRAFETSDDEHESIDDNVDETANVLHSPPMKKQRRLNPPALQHGGVHPSGTMQDIGQHVQPAHQPQIGTDVDPQVVPAGRMDVRTDVPQPVRTDVPQPVRTDVQQPVRTDVQHPVRTDVQHPVRTDVPQPVRTDAQHPVRTDVQQPVRTDVPQPVRTDVDHSVRTDAAQHIPPGVNPHVRINGGPHVQPALGMNVSPFALPPFPPDIQPTSMPRVGTHGNQQGRGDFFGEIRNQDAVQVQRTYAPGPSELQPQGYPQPHLHVRPDLNADGRVQPPASLSSGDQVAFNGHLYNNSGASPHPGASHGAYGHGPYGPLPPHPGYLHPHYMNAPAHQFSNGGGFHPAMHAGPTYPQQYYQHPPAPVPSGSATSMSPPPTYQTAQSGAAYPQPGSHYANPSPWPQQQYQDGRQGQPVSSGAAQPMAHGNAPRMG